MYAPYILRHKLTGLYFDGDSFSALRPTATTYQSHAAIRLLPAPTGSFIIEPVALCVRLFKPRFAPLVASGLKLQTVRPTPKRMPHIGDPISLRQWSGLPYRSKQINLASSTITRLARCSIDSSGITLDGSPTDPNAFALADGFPSFPDLLDWFRLTHGLPFIGILIQWLPPTSTPTPSPPMEREGTTPLPNAPAPHRSGLFLGRKCRRFSFIFFAVD